MYIFKVMRDSFSLIMQIRLVVGCVISLIIFGI